MCILPVAFCIRRRGIEECGWFGTRRKGRWIGRRYASGGWFDVSGGSCSARRSSSFAASGKIDRLAPRFVDLHEWVSEIVDIAGVAGRTQIIVIANGASVTDACEELPSTAVTVALMFIVSRRLRAWPSCGCRARSRGRHERVKECIEERFAFTFGAPRTGGAGTNAIFAIAMTAMLRPKNSSSYAFHRISVELLQP
jgi:hypothetical protein